MEAVPLENGGYLKTNDVHIFIMGNVFHSNCSVHFVIYVALRTFYVLTLPPLESNGGRVKTVKLYRTLKRIITTLTHTKMYLGTKSVHPGQSEQQFRVIDPVVEARSWSLQVPIVSLSLLSIWQSQITKFPQIMQTE